MVRTRFYPYLLVLSLAMIAHRARATPHAPPPAPASTGEVTKRVTLQWVRLPGAESCIGSRELSARVEATLGRSVFVSASGADLLVEGHVESGAGGWQVNLSVAMADGSIVGTRVLEEPGANCRALDEGLVAVIALLIDPDSDTTESAPEAPGSRRPSGPSARVHLGPSVGFGISPAVEWGLRVGVDWAVRDPWSLQLGLSSSVPSDVTLRHEPVRVSGHGGRLALCRGFPTFRYPAFGLCLGFEAGLLVSSLEDREAPVARRSNAGYAAGNLSGAFGWRLAGPLGLVTAAGLSVVAVRPRLSVERLSPESLTLEEFDLYTSGFLAAWGALSATIEF